MITNAVFKDIRWYERIALFFIPMKYSSTKDEICETWIGYKTFRGKFYLLEEFIQFRKNARIQEYK